MKDAEYVVAKTLCSGACVRPELLNESGVCPRHWNRALVIVACLRSAGSLTDSDIEIDRLRGLLFQVAMAVKNPDRDHVDRCVDVMGLIGDSDDWLP